MKNLNSQNLLDLQTLAEVQPRVMLSPYLRKLVFSCLFISFLFIDVKSVEAQQVLHSATDSVIVTTTNLTISDWGRGFRFSPTTDIWVYYIGKRVPANGTYIFNIWDFTTQSKIFEQNSLVDSPTYYIYEPMDSIIKLDSGKQYILQMYGVGSSPYYYGVTSQIGQHLTYYDMRFCNTCNSNTFPTSVLTNYHYGTVDFLYSLSPPCPAVTVPPPSSTSVVQCQAGEVELIASSTDTTYLHYWYDSEFGNNLLHVGDTFTTTFLNKEDTAVFYVNARSPDFLTCPGDRTEAKAIILGNPPAAILPGTLYQGQFNVGGLGNIDLACAGDTLVYEVIPPAGLTNADFGTEWMITGIGIQTSFGISPLDSALFYPTLSSNAGLMFVPALSEGDSTFILHVTVLDLDNGCDTTIQRFISIAPKPEPGFSSPEVCDGVTMPFTNTTIMQGGGTIDYNWDFGDNSHSGLEHPSHLYNAAGNYNATITATTDQGCIASETRVVTVLNNPEALFMIDGHCSNDSILFNNQSITYAGPVVHYWQFGKNNDYSNEQHPKYLYGMQGVYEISLITVNNGCSDTATQFLHVQSAPEASFILSDDCDNMSTEFTNTSVSAPGSMSYEWIIDGNTFNTEHAQYMFPLAGNYTVSLHVIHANQCEDMATEIIEIFPSPDATFTHAQTNFGWVDFTANETGHTSYSWDFGDGNAGTGEFLSHRYAADSTYDVSLIVITDDGCADTIIQKVPVTTINAEMLSPKVNGFKVFPNPYREYTNISYELLSASQVALAVYDLNGKKLALLYKGDQPPGNYSYRFSTVDSGFEPGNLGTILIRLNIDGKQYIQKVTLLQ